MDSLIGPVPDQWRSVPLGAAFDVLTGPSGTRLRLNAEESGVPVVSPRDLRDNVIVGSSGSVSSQVAAELARYRLLSGDVVCSRTGNLGRQALVADQQEGWLPGSACFRLRRRGMLSASYLVHYLGHPAVREWMAANASGSTVPSLSGKALASLPVVVPPAQVQAAVTDVMNSLDQKIDAHRRIVRVTEELRTSLLPLLLTGRAHAR